MPEFDRAMRKNASQNQMVFGSPSHETSQAEAGDFSIQMSDSQLVRSGEWFLEPKTFEQKHHSLPVERELILTK